MFDSNMFGGNQTLTPMKGQQVVPPIQVFMQQDSTALVPLNQNQQRHLDALKNVSVNDIGSFGSEASLTVSKLSDEVLQKVKVGNAGEFGNGINQILTLMSSVDVKKMGESKPGIFTKLKAAVTKVKIDFMGQFNSVATEVENIGNQLSVGIKRMQGEADWLDKMYQANLQSLYEMEDMLVALEALFNQESQVLANMQSDQSIDPMIINDKKIYVDRLGKHCDKMRRLIHLSKLTAPEIRSMQVSNYNNAQKFDDLIQVTIPAWKKQISLGLLSLRQKQDAELAKSIDDKSNEFMRAAADLVHDNLILTAQNANRSVVDIETLQHMQNQFIDAVKQVKQIDEQGRQERVAAVSTLKSMDDQLKQEMRTW